MAPVPTKMTPGIAGSEAASGLPATKKAPPSPMQSTAFSTPPSTPPVSTLTPNGLADKTAEAKSTFGAMEPEPKASEAAGTKSKQTHNSKASMSANSKASIAAKQKENNSTLTAVACKEGANTENPKERSQKSSAAPKKAEADKEVAMTKPSGGSEVAAAGMAAGRRKDIGEVGATNANKPSTSSVECPTKLNGRVEESQGTCWAVTLNCSGGFCWSEKEQEGNVRIAHCDSIELKVLAGTFRGEAAEHLRVVNPLGEESKATGRVDSLGTWWVTWSPTVAGTYQLQLLTADKPCLVNAVIVEPRILVNGREMRSSALNVQTVLSRCLGPIKRWKRMMTSTSELGYNMVHFTPLQTAGESGSCYSIANQHEISANFFSDPTSPPSTPTTEASCQLPEEKRLEELEAAVAMLEVDLGLLSSTDLVLNHTASNSEWIAEHPECGYSTTTCPYLKGACELDIAIKDFSDALVDQKLTKEFGGLREYIANEDDLGRLLWAFKEVCLTKFKMHEWFQLDIDSTLAAFEPRSEGVTKPGSYGDAKKAMMEHVKGMVGSVRGPKLVVAKKVAEELCKSKDELREMLMELQQELCRLGKQTEDMVLSAIEGNVRYERLECQKGPIGKEDWKGLLPRYFTEVKDGSGQTHYLANNGWVMGWDATNDFAARGSLVYLQRRLVVWSDCIKLRYGKGPDDAPFLWQWMTKYCRQTAKIFHGVRLDNCHSTPIHVAKHMLRECRKLRPNLWVYAELFTGEQKVDQHFERELGLNALIREAMQTHSSRDLGLHAIKYCGCEPLGALASVPSTEREHHRKKQLKPSLCPALFYDCTHDNETPNERRTAQDGLATAAVVGASACAVGSSRGFDEMVPHQLNVVTETRLYQDYQGLSAKGAAAAPPGGPAVELSWYGGSSSGRVSVRGDWDHWAEDVPCERTADGVYRANVGSHLKEGCEEYQYKYVVGGEWRHDPDQPCVRDAKGNINNILSITGCRPTGCHTWREGEALPGFMEVKSILNRLHTEMAEAGYSEMEVESIAEDILVIRRHNTNTHACVHFIIRSAFDGKEHTPSYEMPEVTVKGKVNKCYVAAKMAAEKRTGRKAFALDPVKINGLESNLIFQTDFGDMADVSAFDEDRHVTSLRLRNFPAASVLVFSTFGYGEVKKAVDAQLAHRLDEVCSDMDMNAAAYLLYSCEKEEKDLTRGSRGVYEIPGHGKLVYSGLVGVTSLLDQLRDDAPSKALQHPLCTNVRQGQWLLEYLCDRLDGNAFSGQLQAVKHWMVELRTMLHGTPKPSDIALSSDTTASVRSEMPSSGMLHEADVGLQLAHWLRPYYFDLIVCRLYYSIQRAVLDKMSGFVRMSTDPFVHDLAMASLQFYGYVPSGALEAGTEKPSLCAGLPHFATGCMRNWGRDTFISLKGILLATGRFAEAREEILGFARVVRHGLVPNLLDGGSNPRYNARDATWFFLQAIQDYCVASPEGTKFLKTEVHLKFPLEKDQPEVKTIGDLTHHILSEHAKGISFRERNAGSAIDEHMNADGFNVDIKFDKELGVLLGGNELNCGTWMDKMGSSHKAGNKGFPATPRDGSPVEIVGLLKSTLRFVNELPVDMFPYKEVVLSDGTTTMTYKEWNVLLANSFEKYFYVPTEADGNDTVVDSKMVNRRQIYKDVLQAKHPWCDYQLRPNYCVAMAVAPELFDSAHARAALDRVKECLWGASQLGLKTLDPSDFTYRGNYDNADDGDDKHTAHGWNYHQGPEWVWPLGYFLQAKLFFASKKEKAACKQECLSYLVNHRAHIRQSAWRSLPELTNENGKECVFSCPAQAWSVATILSFLQTVADTTD
eukprot:GHVS01097677.1.p1 GENE.GHVS01097677.1~~GHVS01097677.1.p1  ORF type:complete len:1823 (-),score=304.21 GHVS01097677.1:256-5724(-)